MFVLRLSIYVIKYFKDMVIMTEKIPIEIVELYNTVNEKIEKQKPDKEKKRDQAKIAKIIEKVDNKKLPYVEDMYKAMVTFRDDSIVPDLDELKRLRTKKRALEELYPELKE